MVGAFIYRFWQSLFRLLIASGWFRWRIEGLENMPPRESGGMIIAMNHVHWLDIFAVGVLLPFKYRLTWLGKSELFKNPLASWYFRNMQVVPIQRGKRDLSALETSIDLLKDGAIMLIFPEGHRSGTGVLQQGRSGTIRIAMRSGVPIIPAAIIGTQHKLSGTLKRKPVVLRIGEPYTVEPTPNGKIPSDMMTDLVDDMMQRIAALLPVEYRGSYDKQEAVEKTAAT